MEMKNTFLFVSLFSSLPLCAMGGGSEYPVTANDLEREDSSTLDNLRGLVAAGGRGVQRALASESVEMLKAAAQNPSVQKSAVIGMCAAGSYEAARPFFYLTNGHCQQVVGPGVLFVLYGIGSLGWKGVSAGAKVVNTENRVTKLLPGWQPWIVNTFFGLGAVGLASHVTGIKSCDGLIEAGSKLFATPDRSLFTHRGFAAAGIIMAVYDINRVIAKCR